MHTATKDRRNAQHDPASFSLSEKQSFSQPKTEAGELKNRLHYYNDFVHDHKIMTKPETQLLSKETNMANPLFRVTPIFY
jgi:hypothetical protein